MREEHVAWMEEEHIRMLRDQIRIIEDGSARYFSSHDGRPAVWMSQTKRSPDNKRRLAELERLLGGHQ
jgi:SRSO17 transposase